MESGLAGLGALAIVLLPGLAIALCAGLRGLGALALAPALTLAVTGAGAIAAPLIGLTWGWPAALAATATGAALAWALGRALPIHAPRALPRWGRRRWTVLAAVGAGVVAAQTAGALAAMGGLGAVAERRDRMFHANVVREILATGDASPFHAGLINHPDAPASFYPSAVHALIALVPGAGAHLWTALNAIVLVFGTVAWTLGAMYLARILFPSRPVAAVAAAVLSALFQSTPLGLVDVVPNAVGLAVLPALLAWTVQLARVVAIRSAGRATRALVLAGGVAGAALAHPNTLFGYALLAAPVAAHIVRTVTVRAWRRGLRVAAAVGLVVIAAAFALGVWALLATSEMQVVVGYGGWEGPLNPLVAGGGALTDVTSPLQAVPNPVLAAAVVTGAVLALRAKRRRWLVASWGAALALTVAAAARFAPLAFLTGLWYTDRVRIGPLLTVVAVPLATVAVLWAGDAAGRARGWRRQALVGALVAATAASAALAGVRWARFAVAQGYDNASSAARPRFFDADELALLRRLDAELAPGAAVLGDPANGSAFLYSLSGREVVFPHLTGVWGADRAYVRDHFADLGADPRLCAALGRLGVGYFYADPVVYRALPDFAALDRLPTRAGTMTPIDTGGGAAVYEITACD